MSETPYLPVSLRDLEGPLREGGIEIGDLSDGELRMLGVALDHGIRATARGAATALVTLRKMAARGVEDETTPTALPKEDKW